MTATSAIKPKPTTLHTLSGHCRSGAAETLPDGRVRHPTCPGAGASGAGTTWFCTCECHLVVPVCRYCRQIDVELTLDGYCTDQEGCEGAIIRRQEANPVWQQLQQLKQETQQREAEKAAERAASRQAARQHAESEAKASGRPVPAPRARREPKPPPTPQQCHCGCGAMTKGGRFQAGHDAKLKSMLIRAARGEGTKTEAVRAMAELIARDWPRKGVDTKVAERADTLFNDHGPDRLIELAVQRRYQEG